MNGIGKFTLNILMISACSSPGDTKGKVCTYDDDCMSGQTCVKADGVPEGLCQSKAPDTSDSGSSGATTKSNSTTETDDTMSSSGSPTTGSLTSASSTGGNSELIVLCHRPAGDSDWPGNGGEAFGTNRFLVNFKINAGRLEIDENNTVWCREFTPDFAKGVYVDNVDAPIHPAYPGLKVCDVDESNKAAIRCADPASLEDGEQYYFTFEVTHEDPSRLVDMLPLMLTGIVYSGEVAIQSDDP